VQSLCLTPSRAVAFHRLITFRLQKHFRSLPKTTVALTLFSQQLHRK